MNPFDWDPGLSRIDRLVPTPVVMNAASTFAPALLTAGRVLATFLIAAARVAGPFLLAGAALAAALGTFIGVSRAVRRQVRLDERLRRDRMAAAMARVARGAAFDDAIAAEMEGADPKLFWAAAERDDSGRTGRERLRLGRELAGLSHVAVERGHLFDDDPARAQLAAARLGLVLCPESRRMLRRALALGTEPVAAVAARSLARYRDLAALRWILARPERLKRRSVQVWTGLLRGFGPRALPVLASALETGVEDQRLLRAAYEALGFGGHRAAAGVIARGLTHPDPEIRIASARALGRMHAADQTPALLGTLTDRTWQVRALGAWALGRARVAEAMAPLRDGVSDRAWWVRRHCAYALTRLGPSGLETLRGIAATSKDRYAREMAQEALDVTARAHAR